jgi:hypothetical protein
MFCAMLHGRLDFRRFSRSTQDKVPSEDFRRNLSCKSLIIRAFLKEETAGAGNPRFGFMVSTRKNLYLTDFLNRTFRGENAQKSRFLRRGEIKLDPR